ncbi:Translation initiation factor 3 subunit c [Rhizophlyctis rosea]|nr:Translation initiation factor 3 subunit c [Rhizophlyctis rosea]
MPSLSSFWAFFRPKTTSPTASRPTSPFQTSPLSPTPTVAELVGFLKDLNTDPEIVRKAALTLATEAVDALTEADGSPKTGDKGKNTPATETDGAITDESCSVFGKGGKVFEPTPKTLSKKLRELLEARGKKSTDKVTQLANLRKLLEVARNPFQKVKVLLVLIPARFDFTPTTTGFMSMEMWRSTLMEINELFTLLEENAHLSISDFIDEEVDDNAEEVKANAGTPLQIRGNLGSFVDRIDDEFTKSLQNIDPHTLDYFSRLNDEGGLYAIIVRAQKYFKRIGHQEYVDLTKLRRVERLYYKSDISIQTVESHVRNLYPTLTVVLDDPTELVADLCASLYRTSIDHVRTRVLLCHVYHLVQRNRLPQARALLSAHSAPPTSFLRTLKRTIIAILVTPSCDQTLLWNLQIELHDAESLPYCVSFAQDIRLKDLVDEPGIKYPWDALIIVGNQQEMAADDRYAETIRKAYRTLRTIGAYGDGVETLRAASQGNRDFAGCVLAGPNDVGVVESRGVVTVNTLQGVNLKAFVGSFLDNLRKLRCWDREECIIQAKALDRGKGQKAVEERYGYVSIPSTYLNEKTEMEAYLVRDLVAGHRVSLLDICIIEVGGSTARCVVLIRGWESEDALGEDKSCDNLVTNTLSILIEYSRMAIMFDMKEFPDVPDAPYQSPDSTAGLSIVPGSKKRSRDFEEKKDDEHEEEDLFADIVFDNPEALKQVKVSIGIDASPVHDAYAK